MRAWCSAASRPRGWPCRSSPMAARPWLPRSARSASSSPWPARRGDDADERADRERRRRPSAKALVLADGVWGHRKRAARREPREHWTGPQNRMTELRLVVVTGLSGSGKSTAIKVLEDLGFYCIDNLPVALIPRFVEVWESSSEEVRRVALGLDVRERH